MCGFTNGINQLGFEYYHIRQFGMHIQNTLYLKTITGTERFCLSPRIWNG